MALLPLLASLAAISLPAATSGAPPAAGWRHVADFTSYEDVTRLPEGRCTVVVSDCEACAYGADGRLTCSNPGIACTASRWSCMKFDVGAAR